MNDTLIALGIAVAALTPFLWILFRHWIRIRPLRHADVRWRLDAPDATNILVKRYSVHGEWLAAEWRSQFQSQGSVWLLRATSVQLEQLREAGWGSCFTQNEQMLTRGQAMDLLMLAKAPEDEDRQLLEFFNIKIEASNALVVSQQAAILRMNDQEMQKWNERPATPVQKEAIRYFQGKVPRSISAESATQVLSSIKSELYQTGNADKWTSWLLFSDTWLQLQNSEICIQYDIKKPTPIKIREALFSLMAEDIAEWNDKDVVVQRLVELYPELELRSTPVSMQIV